MDDVKGLCERLERGALHSGHSSDWWVEYCRTIREAATALTAAQARIRELEAQVTAYEAARSAEPRSA